MLGLSAAALILLALKCDGWTDFEGKRNRLLCLNNLRKAGT